ncbi:MAG: DUF2958 domain-containing protein [candidate division Zixibacteria bacterium]|nr:DUF2958 domain-containing protein [candidate division Zixibacteria bacterium]
MKKRGIKDEERNDECGAKGASEIEISVLVPYRKGEKWGFYDLCCTCYRKPRLTHLWANQRGHLPKTDTRGGAMLHPRSSHVQLLPREIADMLPPLYAMESTPESDHVIYVKFFDPRSQWTWYACEYDPKERLCFGYVVGYEKEWGYFSLDEFESLKMPDGITSRIERDLQFTPILFKNLHI